VLAGQGAAQAALEAVGAVLDDGDVRTIDQLRGQRRDVQHLSVEMDGHHRPSGGR